MRRIELMAARECTHVNVRVDVPVVKVYKWKD